MLAWSWLPQAKCYNSLSTFKVDEKCRQLWWQSFNLILVELKPSKVVKLSFLLDKYCFVCLHKWSRQKVANIWKYQSTIQILRSSSNRWSRMSHFVCRSLVFTTQGRWAIAIRICLISAIGLFRFSSWSETIEIHIDKIAIDLFDRWLCPNLWLLGGTTPCCAHIML